MTLPAAPGFPILADAGPLVVNGEPRFGQFSDSLPIINHDDFQLTTPFGRPAGTLAGWLGFKEFQYFGGMSQRLVFGCALAHLRHVGVAFVYVYDLETGELHSHSLRSPFGLGLQLAGNPVQGESRFRRGGADIRMRYEAQPRQKSLEILLGDEIELRAVMPEAGFQPMSLCTRAGYSGWTYTNKTGGLPLQGELRWRGQRFDLQALEALGHHDFSCGFMRRETFWNWACFSGMSGGHRLGLNLSCGVNETSFTENCLWVDGRLLKTNFARFRFDRADVLQPWQICSDDGQASLCFTPLGMHRERLNLGLVASNFRQLFGRFDGELNIDGRLIPVRGLPGFVEDQYAKW